MDIHGLHEKDNLKIFCGPIGLPTLIISRDPPSGASPYDTIYWLIPKNKKKPAKPIILDSAGIVPCSGAGLFLVHELLEGNPVLDCDLVAFLNINPFNQSADDHMPDLSLGSVVNLAPGA